MKFLVDVNASGALWHWLLDNGYDVAQVSNVDPRMGDDDILTWAVLEQRVIITTDQDFEEKIWRAGKRHNGVFRIRKPFKV